MSETAKISTDIIASKTMFILLNGYGKILAVKICAANSRIIVEILKITVTIDLDFINLFGTKY